MNLQRLLFVAVSACALAGCAGDSERWQRELDETRKQISQLEAENVAMQERLEALEATGPVHLERELPPEDERPELSVVRLEPDEAVPSQPVVVPSSVPEPPPAEEAKTVIVGRGTKVESWDREGTSP